MPRSVFERFVDTLQNRQVAESFAASLEGAFAGLEGRVHQETIGRMVLMKAEIKDDLSKTLVTRELFEERMRGIHQQFQGVDLKFHALEDKMEQRFLGVDQKFQGVDQKFKGVDLRIQSLENKIDERFKRNDLWLKFLVFLVLLLMAMVNPGLPAILMKFVK